jgi:hypothetical protein
MESPVIYKNTARQNKGNKTTQAAIYISKEDRVKRGEIVQGVLEKKSDINSIDPAILSHILDALSQGVAKSIVAAAIKSINSTDSTYTEQDSA